MYVLHFLTIMYINNVNMPIKNLSVFQLIIICHSCHEKRLTEIRIDTGPCRTLMPCIKVGMAHFACPDIGFTL